MDALRCFDEEVLAKNELVGDLLYADMNIRLHPIRPKTIRPKPIRPKTIRPKKGPFDRISLTLII